MKLPDIFSRLTNKAPVQDEAYVSLALEARVVEAAIFTLPRGKSPHVREKTIESVEDDSWEKRLEACDRAIARVADASGRDDFKKVVLGLPVSMLTRDDDIEHPSRSAIRKLAEALELTPIGFVPIHQAIIHAIHQEEGVPPSVILMEIGPKESMMILYKVGTEAGRVSIPNSDFVPALERALRGFKELEVLPSRILLYGAGKEELDGYARDLLKHPWQTRANFLHYPKIDVLPALTLAGAVSLAGASELSGRMQEEEQVSDSHRPVSPEHAQSGAGLRGNDGVSNEDDAGVHGNDEERFQDDHEENRKDEEGSDGRQDSSEDAYQTGQEIAVDDGPKDTPREESDGGRIGEEDQNVVEVTPEALGFRHDVDILEKPDQTNFSVSAAEKEKKEEEAKFIWIKDWFSRAASGVSLPRVIPSKTGFIAVIMLALIAALAGWLTYWVLPSAVITVYQIPAEVSESVSITVNPTATVVDGATKTVPGRKQEKTVSGDKTIAVTGQKDIGDPARGTVTVYNKSLIQKQLKKGTVLSSGSLLYTLDTDIAIASASESLANGSVTYGKANVPITAVALGTQSNVPAGTEFSIKDTPTSVMIARNDAALTGGTSKVVTVVSRADQNNLLETLTKDLVQKAKAELGGGVSGGERLIDETVKTAITNKKFDAEPDQEARELHGTISVAITGISYRDEDVASLFTDLVAGSVPNGYALVRGGARMQASQIKLQKDGNIGLTIQYYGQALPVFDITTIRKSLAGKTPSQADGILRAIQGAGGFEVKRLSGFLWGKSFPANAGNITVSVAVLE